MKESINIDRVPYGLAVHGSEEEEAVLEVIKNHKTIMGDNVKLFEKKVSDLFGKELGIMVNSGSSANLLAMELLDCPKNSEVITPILTFATTLSPILKKELTPVFVDVDEQTYNISPQKIEETILELQQKGYGSQIKAIMTVDLFGLPANYPEIQKIANKYKIPLDIGLDFSNVNVNRRERSKAKISCIIHIDIFKFIRRVVSLTMKTDRYDLSSVANELIGEKKKDVELDNLAEDWDNGKNLEEYAKYTF